MAAILNQLWIEIFARNLILAQHGKLWSSDSHMFKVA